MNVYLDRLCCRYTGNKVILIFQELRPSGWVCTHRTCLMHNTLQPGRGGAKGQTAGHTQLSLKATTSLSPREVTLWGTACAAPGLPRKKKKPQNICWPTFLMLNHEVKYSCSFYWTDQIIPWICRALSNTQTRQVHFSLLESISCRAEH